MRHAVAWLISAVIALLPLKFGTLAGAPDRYSFYPADFFAWIITPWPSVSFPTAAGGVLLLALVIFPVRIQNSRVAFTVTALWLLVAFISIIGAVNASTMDYVIVYVVHIFGFTALGAATWLMLSNLPEFKQVVLLSIIAGVMLTAIYGIEQRLCGFEENHRFIESQGNGISGDLRARLLDTRIFACFASCNSLAGYLLLTMPLCFCLCWQLSGKVKYCRISRAVFMLLLALLLGTVFFSTLSRGAFLSLVIAGTIFIMIFPVRKTIRIAVFILVPSVIIAGAFYITYVGRGFSSMLVRFDYIYASFQMFLNHPWMGTGWGDFFYDYMRLKLTMSKEAPHAAHNILMDFLGQTGSAGFAVCLAAIVYPIVKIAGKIRNTAGNLLFASLNSYVIFGLIAYFIHSLMDVNLQISASMATAVVLMVTITAPEVKEKAPDGKKKSVAKALNDRKKSSLMLLAANLSVTAVMLVAGFVALCGGYHLLKADYAFYKLSKLCSARGKSRKQYFSVNPEQIKSELKNCVAVRPYSPFPWAVAASFMMMRGYADNAEDYFNKARELTPQYSVIYFRLYMLQKAQGRDAEAQKNLDIARKLFPHKADYYQDEHMNKTAIVPLKD